MWGLSTDEKYRYGTSKQVLLYYAVNICTMKRRGGGFLMVVSDLAGFINN
jgi:hypothetical protein